MKHETSQRSAGSRFEMIDVGAKQVTHRVAVAQGRIQVGPEAFARIQNRTMPKGDVLAMAEVAGIQAAKKTADLLPLCHPLPLESVRVRFESDSSTHSFWAFCTAAANAKTGVEMEALAGVQGALLSIYDLTKGIEPALEISDIRLNRKQGGKHGLWVHPKSRDDEGLGHEANQAPLLQGVRAAVLTLSDRCAAGEKEDESGIVIQKHLQQNGALVEHYRIVPDSESVLSEAVVQWAEQAVELIISTGGTGLGPRDVTTQTLRKLANREVSGLGEILRSASAAFTRKAWLSDASAFILRNSLILCLPGSPKAVGECLGIVGDLIPHALHVIRGGDHGK
ncbi:MAG: bifunctional molybdenum cofactor biosynthesis protein MoaC/MoaB [Bdellovibrionales bacterium]|nr:bifunctional molybdenum cofactor biosynthesis protein MoaC/MoaB [Bdellovibrionales bacterium]